MALHIPSGSRLGPRPLPHGFRSFHLRSVLLVAAWMVVLLAPGPSLAKDEEWPEIPASEMSLKSVPADPDADGVVLLNERHGRILKRADDWVNVLEYKWRAKILTEAGRSLGSVSIPASKYSRVSNIRARTVRPDGTFTPVAADQIFEKVLYETSDYRVSDWVFNFPGVEPGVIIEYRYDRHDSYLYYMAPFYFEGPEYTLRANVTQGVPNKMGYTILCELCPPGTEPSITKWTEGTAKGQYYQIELTNLPGYRSEQLMPPRREVSPRMEMLLIWWEDYADWGLGRQDDYFVDWPSVALFVGRHYKRAVDDGVTWAKLDVKRWVEGITDPNSQIEAVLDHVRHDFRYIEWRNLGGWVRHVKEILATKVADSEEKAVVMLTALELLGIKAYPALVSGQHVGTVNPKFNCISQFSHVLIAIPKEDGTYRWLDPTLDHAPADFGSWRNSGADALLIKGLEGEMIKLPKMVERSSTRYEIALKALDGGLAELAMMVKFTGEDALERRSEWAPLSEGVRTAAISEWARESNSGAEVVSYSFSNMDDPRKPLELQMTLRAPGLVTSAGDTMLIDATAFTSLTSNPVSKRKRIYPFYVEPGWNIQEEVTISPPEGMKVAELPPPSVAHSSIGKLTLRCSEEPDGGARCTRSFIASRNRWHAKESESFRSMYDEIVTVDRSAVAFQKVVVATGS